MKYLHLRNTQPDGTPATHGGVTVLYDVVGQHRAEGAYAICSDKDNYWRARGRSICNRRYELSDPHHTFSIPISDNAPVTQQVAEYINHMYSQWKLRRRKSCSANA